MSIQLITEVMDHAPEDLTSGQRLVLIVIAEKASDTTRKAWPGHELLTRRAGMTLRGVQKAIAALEARGLLERVPAGVDKNGAPVYAHEGHAVVYRIPPMGAEDSGRVVELHQRPKGPQRMNHSSPSGVSRGRTVVRERANCGSSEGEPQFAPSLKEPSGNPQSPRATTKDLTRVITAIIEKTEKSGISLGAERRGQIDETFARQVVALYCGERSDIDNPIAWTVRCISNEQDHSRYLPIPQPPRFVREVV